MRSHDWEGRLLELQIQLIGALGRSFETSNGHKATNRKSRTTCTGILKNRGSYYKCETRNVTPLLNKSSPLTRLCLINYQCLLKVLLLMWLWRINFCVCTSERESESPFSQVCESCLHGCCCF